MCLSEELELERRTKLETEKRPANQGWEPGQADVRVGGDEETGVEEDIMRAVMEQSLRERAEEQEELDRALAQSLTDSHDTSPASRGGTRGAGVAIAPQATGGSTPLKFGRLPFPRAGSESATEVQGSGGNAAGAGSGALWDRGAAGSVAAAPRGTLGMTALQRAPAVAASRGGLAVRGGVRGREGVKG